MTRSLTLLTLVALLASAGGCGGRRGRDAAGSAEDRFAETYPALVVVVPQEPDHLVPPLARSSASAAIWPWILPSLVRIDGDSLENAHYVGDLATTWQFEDGGRGMRFRLDPNRFWEDTTAVGAPDVQLSYRLYRDPSIAGSWPARLNEIESVETIESTGEVLFRFRRPLARARALELASLPLISAEDWARSQKRKTRLGEPGYPVRAAGPFRVVEWEPGQQMLLERHPFAPLDRTPRSEKILLRFLPSGRSRALAVATGAADLALDLPPEEMPRLQEETGEVRLVRAGVTAVEALVWNLDDLGWGRLGPRQVVGSALDRARIRAAAAGGTDMLSSAEDWEGLLTRTLLRTEVARPRPIPAAGAFPVEGGVSAEDSVPAEGGVSTGGGGPIEGDVSIPGPSIAPGFSFDSVPDTAAARSSLPGFSALLSHEPDSQGGAPVAAATRGAGAGADSAATATADSSRFASEGAAPDSAAIAAALALYGPLDLEILYDPANARRERIAVEILLQLEALGVRCRLQPATATEVADRIAQRRFQAAVVAWKRPAVQDLGELWGRGGSYNVAGLAAPAVDSLIQVARSPLADTLSNVWQKVEAKALALRPCAILDGHVRFDALGARLIGYHPDPLSPYGDLLTIERRDDGRPADLSAAAPPASHRH